MMVTVTAGKGERSGGKNREGLTDSQRRAISNKQEITVIDHQCHPEKLHSHGLKFQNCALKMSVTLNSVS